MNQRNQKEAPLRVLHVLTGLNSGGAESYIMNIYRHIDKSKIQFDFLLRSNDNIYKSELDQMGSNVYVTDSFPRHFIKNAIQTYLFFKTHHYQVIHVHANALLYMFALRCAKRNDIKCRIIHSHNSSMAHMQLLPIHEFNKRHIGNLATDYFACSDAAGEWMFGNNYTVMKNAVDTDAFEFDAEKRRNIRNELGINDNRLVIGHVGRFSEQKNHAFLIDIFAEIVKKRPDAKLLLVGGGDLKQIIADKIEKLDLAGNVIFLGVRKDVSNIINAFDVFAFPSLYEGLPIVIVEAQANGLPIFCSEAVPMQAILVDGVHVLPLESGADYWANCILNTDISRNKTKHKIIAAGFDIKTEAQKMQEFYLSRAER